MGSAPIVRTYVELAASVRAAAPRLGQVRLVAVDGGAGSGKTTFAGRLGAALDAPVLHTDDLLEGWTDMVTFWPRLEDWVLTPLRAGNAGRYRRYDWDQACFAEWNEVAPAPVLIVEGVTAARAALRPELVLSVWVEARAERRLERGIARDGEGLRAEWVRWMADEADFVASDRTPESVDLVVHGDPTLPHDPATQFVQLRSALG